MCGVCIFVGVWYRVLCVAFDCHRCVCFLLYNGYAACVSSDEMLFFRCDWHCFDVYIEFCFMLHNAFRSLR